MKKQHAGPKSGVFVLAIESAASYDSEEAMLMLKLYWADADRLPLPETEQISERRRKELVSVRNDRVRRAALCAERLLHEAVKREDADYPLPLAVLTEEQGKPFLSGREYEFNLSHSDHYAACAIADYPVGLDIQILSSCGEKLVKRFSSEREQDVIFSAEDRDAAFTRLWCRKESYLKALGCGLRTELSSLDVSGEDPLLSEGGKTYSFFEFQAGPLFFCLCAERDKLLADAPPPIVRLG